MIAAASGVAAFVLATSPVMGSETWTYVIGGLLCALIGWGAARFFKWVNSVRYERLLVRGRGAKPGLARIPPLGDRLTGLESGQAALKTTADEHTQTLSEHGDLLHFLVGELSHNGGSSFRDHVEAAAKRAEDSARAAAQAANNAHVAASKAAKLDQKMADHFGVNTAD